MNPAISSPHNDGGDAVPASSPQTTPKGIGYGHPEYNFVQGLMELQKSVVRMETILESVKQTTDDTKSKVSRLEKIAYTAGVILVILIAMGGWALNTAKDFGMMYYKASIEIQQKQLAQPTPGTPGKLKP